VPVDYEADPSLARWVKTQKQANRFGRVPEERKSILDSLGFDWTADEDADIDPEWDMQFENLKSYQEEYGNCNASDFLIDCVLQMKENYMSDFLPYLKISGSEGLRR
jgi:hypothetical protein